MISKHVAIDASNIRAGGGLTHLCELLAATEPGEYGIEWVRVYGGKSTLQNLPIRDWLEPIHDPRLDMGLVQRIAWQNGTLHNLRAEKVDVLFTPGASITSSDVPIVSMSQNLLPFEVRERRRYGLSFRRWRYEVLRRTQARSFMSACGVVFLTEYARRLVVAQLSHPPEQIAVIPHGISGRFQCPPRAQKGLEHYSKENPFRLLYISTVGLYKHQWHVADAIGLLRGEGIPVAVDFVGQVGDTSLRKLQDAMYRWDPKHAYIWYQGPVPYAKIQDTYRSADAFVFASSCENMPIILLEAMASGLPVACSNRGPMPEVLGNAGVYFDPEKPDEIADSLRLLMTDPALREHCAWSAFERSKSYSWERCADETFSFLAEVAREHSGNKG